MTVKRMSGGDVPLADRVYMQLGTALRGGDFTPGQSLKLRKLADAFGTSQTPVREALSSLVAQHALEFHPVNRSVIVPVLDKSTVKEIYAIRIELEAMAAEMAATRIRPPELKRLFSLQKELQRAARANARHMFLHLNMEFLFGVFRAAGAPRLLRIIEGLWLQVGPTQAMLLSRVDDVAPITRPEDYEKLLRVFEARDAKTAGQLVRRRLRGILKLVVDNMD